MVALAGGLGIGAGVGISSVALAPFNAANTFMGSAFFGYGMILGERYMYQADWPKIQQRLENGEKIENIIQEYTGTFTAVVMAEAKIIFDSVTQEFLKFIKEGLFPEGTLAADIEHFLHGHGFQQPHQTETDFVSDPHKFLSPTEQQIHQAHGHPQGIPTPTPTPIPTPTPTPTESAIQEFNRTKLPPTRTLTNAEFRFIMQYFQSELNRMWVMVQESCDKSKSSFNGTRCTSAKTRMGRLQVHITTMYTRYPNLTLTT